MRFEGPRSWTRAEFIRGVARAGVGITAGGGLVADRLAIVSNTRAAPSVVDGATFHHFHTRPDLRPLVLTATRGQGALAPGMLFMAPATPDSQRGPLITDDDGQPVWFNPTTPISTENFRVAVYRGQPVLTWWEGTDPGGLGRGTHVIADAHYRVVGRVSAGNGMPSDLHEFLVTSSGTALVTSWETVTRDLRAFRGPAKGEVVGGVVQELELPSGRVLFEWHSLDHIALDESYSGYQRSYGYFDYLHLNSIAPTDDGNLLISGRNTWGVYKIDRGSGQVLWRLGGKKNDFRMGDGTLFAWQHDARPHSGGLISLFDDGSAPKVQPQSRGLVLAVDTRRMRVSLQRAYVHSPPVLAWALGNTQLLPDGNVLVGFGTVPHLTEFGVDGTTRLDLALPPTGQNYRALRFPWTGRPLDQPRLALASEQFFVSWNGATDVASWQLQTGATSEQVTTPALNRPRQGFETALPVPSGARYAAAVALDKDGRPLGRSQTLRL